MLNLLLHHYPHRGASGIRLVKQWGSILDHFPTKLIWLSHILKISGVSSWFKVWALTGPLPHVDSLCLRSCSRFTLVITSVLGVSLVLVLLHHLTCNKLQQLDSRPHIILSETTWIHFPLELSKPRGSKAENHDAPSTLLHLWGDVFMFVYGLLLTSYITLFFP